MRRTLVALIAVSGVARAGELEDILEEAGRARRAGDHARTLLLLERAYAIQPIPELLNNIGRTLEELGRYGEAIDAYRKVVGDPAAKAQLVELDRRRLVELEPRLRSAWVLIDAKPDDALVHVDGVEIPARREVEVEPGRHLVQLTRSDGRGVLVTFINSGLGRRITVGRDMDAIAAESAALDLEGTVSSILEVSIDDRPIRADFMKGVKIHLEPGVYKVTVQLEGREPRIEDLRFEANGAVVLASILDPEVIGEPEPPAIVLEPMDPGPGPWPMVVGAFGAIGVGLGVFLLASAEVDRGRVRNAVQRDDGVVTGITMIEAIRLESRANDKGTAGIISVSAGVAIGAAALFWWLLSPEPEPTLALSF